MARITSRRAAEEETVDVAENDEVEDNEQESSSRTARKDRPTPRQREESRSSGNAVSRFIEATQDYFLEVRDELRKVTWLSRDEVLRLSYIVIVVTAVSATFLGLVGFIFGLLTQALASAGSSILAGGITIALVVVVAGGWLFRETLFPNHLE